MSHSILQPVGQVRLTNVAIVRLKKGGKRFEIACYKNKALNWRNGVETDIDEVLQTDRVFNNVSKGVIAKDADLVAAFGSSDQATCCAAILEHGQMQVSDKERSAQLESLSHDIATVIASKTVNTETGTPYPVAAIERAMQDAHISLNAMQSAKQQALDVIRHLQKAIPIERVRLQIRVDAPADMVDEIEAALLTDVPGAEHCSTARAASMSSITLLIEPAAYRVVEAAVEKLGGRRAAVTVLAHVAPRATGSSSTSGDAASASGVGDAAVAVTTASHGPVAAAAEAASVGLGSTYVAGEKASPASAAATAAETGTGTATISATSGAAFACRKCAGAWFTTREAYREHFRCDWHRVNLKRGMRKQAPWSEAQWLALTDEQRTRALVSEDAKA